jgi:hypothetical protein
MSAPFYLATLKHAELLMWFSPQPGKFTNCRRDPLDLDFGLIAHIVSKFLYGGHEVAFEDTIRKRGGGVCGSLLA